VRQHHERSFNSLTEQLCTDCSASAAYAASRSKYSQQPVATCHTV
jgi:hypothetical protein